MWRAPLCGQRFIIDGLTYRDFEVSILISKELTFLDEEVYENCPIFENVMTNFASLANAIARKPKINDTVQVTIKSLLSVLFEPVLRLKDKRMLLFNFRNFS